ncbi:MAG: TadE/TadG family type IV pilus assembly protein [Chakrabartia sp.]
MENAAPIKAERTRLTGFLQRLRSDTAGNTLAMAAAAVFPLAGLVGGALDMSRIYLVKTRLQAACDAGSLTGRRVMGSGTWAFNSYAARTAASNMFRTNFETGSYGTGAITTSFSELNGNVRGSASTTIPMTLMQIFGQTSQTVAVTCNSEMRIPNSDVMFVLDVTGSMDDPIPGDPTNTKKIDGIKVAVKCFYEALAKINITDVTPAQCGVSADPAGGNAPGVQLRFGVVPFSQIVNVGKLLPNQHMADDWTYQSRAPNMQTIQTYTLGTESAKKDWTAWTPSTTPSSPSYGGWKNSAVNVTNGGTTYPKTVSGRTSANCASTTPSPNSYVSDVGGTITQAFVSSTTPTHPDTVQTLKYSETDPRTVSAYQYSWSRDPITATSGTRTCRLQVKTATYNRVRTDGTSTKDITWAPQQVVANWTYKPVEHDVSSLKAGGSTWNSSVNLPLTESSLPALFVSGSKTSVTGYKAVSNTPVSWQGCIEERDTFRNLDDNPSDEWSPIPSTAKDMDIDLVPTAGDVTTQWRPALNGAVWGRTDSISGTSWSVGSSWTTAEVTGGLVSNQLKSLACPTESRKLQIYDDSTKAADFKTYINSLSPTGFTYHDIGLIWGARLMSSTGIFASENATSSTGGAIERHMVFMTDGITDNRNDNYSAYGAQWWDRRQTKTSAAPTFGQTSLITDVVNARAIALCNAIKNKNINLWVVYYGTTSDVPTLTRLSNCATDASHFFNATNTPALIANFRQIADAISQLRLTN